MVQRKRITAIFSCLFSLLLFFSVPVYAQHILNRTVNISINRQPIPDVLAIISNQADFYFSYNSTIIRKDSLVSIPAGKRTVKSILDLLFPFGFEFKETGNYLIIRRAPLSLTLISEQSPSEDSYYQVSGYVRDDQTGENISYASVYEKQRLAAALTNDQGYFRLRLKSKYATARLSISKEFYEDTTVSLQAGYNQRVNITLSPATFQGATVIIGPNQLELPDSVYFSIPQPDSTDLIYLFKKIDSSTLQRTRLNRFLLASRLKLQSINLGKIFTSKKDSLGVQRTALGNFLLSAKLKTQSVNMEKFYTERAYQVSLTPGLSSNGKMNAQVVNNFSFNVLGGYSGGVNKLELGGLFNIDKRDVQYAQVAGMLNIVGGTVSGIQAAGLANIALDSVKAVQLSGYVNFIKGSFTGMQLTGWYNYVNGKVKGVQMAGIVNFTRRNMNGWQLGGVGNITGETVRGVQTAPIFNYSRNLKGVQIGLVNIADSSDGYSIGLINIVMKGYHKLALNTTELLPYNAAFKTGNHKLYSILLGGINANKEKAYSFGYGLGTALTFSKWLGLNAELSTQYAYLGDQEKINLVNKAGIHLELRFGKYFSIYAGPSFNAYLSDQYAGVPGYRYPLVPGNLHTHELGKNWTGWTGWTAGIQLF